MCADARYWLYNVDATQESNNKRRFILFYF